jgi:predicted methyltransferase
MFRKFALAGAGALALVLALTPAIAQNAPQDALTDPAMKAPEVIAFIGLKPGDKVADIVGGRFLRALSKAVGPTGTVYAVETAEMVKLHPELSKLTTALAAAPGSNVVPSADPIASPLPKGLDAVFIRQDYHDLYDKFMGPVDVAAFNKNVYAALKPGGVYVILDHEDVAGSGIAHTETTHRIEGARVKADLAAAGFKFDGESKIFANPADDHSKFVFDAAIHGKTDQFLYRFKKPA